MKQTPMAIFLGFALHIGYTKRASRTFDFPSQPSQSETARYILHTQPDEFDHRLAQLPMFYKLVLKLSPFVHIRSSNGVTDKGSGLNLL
jgi:hypothetical protein